MTPGNQSSAAPFRHPLFGDVGRNWGWLLALGILSVILGIIGLGMTFLLTVASVLYFGILITVVGGVQVFQGLQVHGVEERSLSRVDRDPVRGGGAS